MSEYSRPIYRFLRLDHFETPRHIRDLIRDSEQPLVIKSYKLIIQIVLRVWTLWVQELCRHDQDTSLVNNQ